MRLAGILCRHLQYLWKLRLGWDAVYRQGPSFGGRVSFEIAQQLVREGERVSFLGLIDTTGGVKPIERWSWVSEAAGLSRKVQGVRSLRELLFRGLGYARLRGLNYMGHIVLIIRNPILDLWCRLRRSIPYKYRPTYWQWITHRANRAYVLKPFPGH